MQPMSVDDVLTSTDRITQVRASNSSLYWQTSVAADDGRVTVMTLRDGRPVDLTPAVSVRSQVMGYGGGAWDVADDVLVYCDNRTRRVWVLEAGQPRPITEDQRRFRYGSLHLHVASRQVVAVREDHDAQPEVRTEIVALSLDEDNAAGGQVLESGADFYAGPVVHGDELAWCQWDHPNMPWDTASVWRAPLSDLTHPVPVMARGDVSANHPLFSPSGELAFVSDESGYWNWHLGDATWSIPQDCSGPIWVLDQPAACVVDENRIASVVFHDGAGTLHLWDRRSGQDTELLQATATIDSVAAMDDQLYVIAQWPTRYPSLEQIDLATGEVRTVLGGEEAPHAVAPVSITGDGPAGTVQAFVYPAGAAGPLLVMTHGGPTGNTDPSYNPTIAYWVSRGVSVLDVNYSGSTGFGRAYRQRLNDNWGVLDVADVQAAVAKAVQLGYANPAQVVITGGSAGGYTTLQALVTSDSFAAGMSRYGVADLHALVADTHKFESRYLDSLVGPLPQAADIYDARSPIQHLDQLRTPILILQGDRDTVVPPNQALSMAEAVRSKGLPVAVLIFEGEEHGFRRLETRRAALEAQTSFLQQVLSLEHSADIPQLEVENLA